MAAQTLTVLRIHYSKFFKKPQVLQWQVKSSMTTITEVQTLPNQFCQLNL